MELRSSFKEHKREEKKSEGGAGKGVERGFFFEAAGAEGVDRKSVKHFGTWSPRSDGTFVPVSFAC